MAVILDWCSTCKHIRPNKDGWIMNCDAFTEEIPDDFVKNISAAVNYKAVRLV